MHTAKDILTEKGRAVWSVKPTNTVLEALGLMAQHDIGAVLVMDGDRLAGVFTERDYARKVVLAGADGIAFIADSQRSSASANQYSWRDMEANLKSNGIDFDQIPKVIQFNKRDLPDVKPLQEIKDAWGELPTFPAVATRGEGVLETFRELLSGLYRSIDTRHGFGANFGITEQDFLKGVFANIKQP